MNKTPKPAITEFSQETVEAIDNYVYALVDPRTPETDPSRIFYVGKGKGQRCFAHAAAAVKWKPKKEPNPKIKRIRRIRKATGAPPPIQIIAHKLSDPESYRLETAFISVLHTDPQFCGLVAGKHGSDYGLTVDEIEGLYSDPLKESAIGHRVLLVSLNGGEDLPPFPEIKESDMAERVLGWWPLSAERAVQVEYIIGCYHLLIRRVFKVKQMEGRAVHKKEKCGKNKKGYPIWKQVFKGERCVKMEHLWANRRIVNSKGDVLTTFPWQVGTRLIGKHS